MSNLHHWSQWKLDESVPIAYSLQSQVIADRAVSLAVSLSVYKVYKLICLDRLGAGAV
jgi:hypothetical protein